MEKRYPCIIGTDLNETIRWGEDGEMMAGTANLNYFVNNASAQGWTPVTPKPECRRMPAHYPRDANREGCQIDALWSRQVSMSPVVIDAEARHRSGTDHALLSSRRMLQCKPTKWGNDSRPRFVVRHLPDEPLVDVDDISALAKTHTKPLPG